jgi:hypothetical protein
MPIASWRESSLGNCSISATKSHPCATHREALFPLSFIIHRHAQLAKAGAHAGIGAESAPDRQTPARKSATVREFTRAAGMAETDALAEPRPIHIGHGALIAG